MPHAFRHHHHRERELEGRSPIDTQLTRAIDVIVYPIGIASLALGLPQVYEVWVLGNVAGVSVLSWGAWAIFNIFWIFYGIVHRTPALVYLYIGWFIINSTVAIGAFLKS